MIPIILLSQIIYLLTNDGDFLGYWFCFFFFFAIFLDHLKPILVLWYKDQRLNSNTSMKAFESVVCKNTTIIIIIMLIIMQ